MPVRTAVKNREDDSIVVYRYYGLVSPQDIVGSLSTAFASLPAGLPYRALMIFEDQVDLSELSPKILESLRAHGEKTYLENNLGPRTGAAVLNNSSDAQLIVPLFNALNQARRGIDFSFELCPDVASALTHLGIAQAEGEEIIAQTA